jgi:hypothetical protein
MPEASRIDGADSSKAADADNFASPSKNQIQYWLDLSLGLPPDLAGRLRAQQVSAILRVTPVMMAANILAAILCAVIFWCDANLWFLTLWTSAFIVTSLIGLKTSILARSRQTPRTASKRAITRVVPSEIRLELAWRILREHEGIVSGGKVNWLIDGLCGEGLPTIDLTHVDLS